jgi:hypothetical protein
MCPYTLKGEASSNWIEDGTRYLITLPHHLTQRPPSRVGLPKGVTIVRVTRRRVVGSREPIRLD